MTDMTEKFTDLNPYDELIASTDFYRFLIAHGAGDRRLNDITAYLMDRGYLLGRDTVSQPVLDTLKLIHDHYCARQPRGTTGSQS